MVNMFKYHLFVLALTLRLTCGQIPGLGYFQALARFVRDGTEQYEMKTKDSDTVLSEYDFIVVGAGTAGCTLASRLSEIPEWKVLLIEAGREENYVMDIPLIANVFQFTDINWKYKTAPSDKYCLGMNNNQCRWPRGKVMGGSSVLNYMVYTRGNRRDFDRWRDLGNPGWGYDDVFPYFQKIENFKIAEFNDSYHNTGGYLDIEYADYRTPAATQWVKASQEAGHRYRDPNGAKQTGVSFLQLTLRNGARLSSNRAYLYPIKYRKNLHVLKNTLVTKIITEGNRARGVEILRNGKTYSLYARKEVIVSGGTINSPQILMLSGIGPREDLEKLNIPVVSDLKVGYNLMDHVSSGGLSFDLNSNVSYLTPANVFSDENSLRLWTEGGKGKLTVAGGCEALTFIDLENRNVDDGWTDMELFFLSGSARSDPLLRYNVGLKDSIFESIAADKLGPTFSILPMIMRPKSKGRITLRNRNPRAHPIITPNYFEDEADVRTMLKGIRETQRIAGMPALQEIGARLNEKKVIPKCAKLGYDSDEYWICVMRHLPFTIYHYSGTCKMGPRSDPSAVVDARLRVHGVSNLRVVDASIMPEVTSGHTNSPVYMIAEKAADMIKQDWLGNYL